MYPDPRRIKRHPLKTNIADAEYKMFSTLAEFSGLSQAELARIIIREWMATRIAKYRQYQQDRPA